MRFLLPLVFFATTLSAAEVRVFAAASLTDALKEIAATYEKQTGDRIVFNFAASSTLSRQIQSGAPADLFFSADDPKMDRLQKRGMIVPATRTSVLSNTLVIIGARSPQELVGKRVALAEPSSVPAGIYAKTYLKKIGLWEKIAPAVIPTDNARAALAAVESGNADAAIVYKTDAMISKRVSIGYEIKNGPPISYPFALLRYASNPEGGRRFLDYVRSPAALRVFAKHGFIVTPRP